MVQGTGYRARRAVRVQGTGGGTGPVGQLRVQGTRLVGQSGSRVQGPGSRVQGL